MESVNYEIDEDNSQEATENKEEIAKQPICQDCKDKCIECLFSVLKGAGHR